MRLAWVGGEPVAVVVRKKGSSQQMVAEGSTVYAATMSLQRHGELYRWLHLQSIVARWSVVATMGGWPGWGVGKLAWRVAMR
jgi:hypothetical protein